ncbi:type I-E CRISPR-associated protein Cas6/Cse3/CasE [Streptomyces sp. NPDC052396]|uniref:type I-E CRISPR-associated protein Cas6/Cse3/CasE n=1 Tax=Streptomyces sp. NPDC052396 TaxID=3365689 RepID=UPI0037D34DFD
MEPLLDALGHGRRLSYCCDANPVRRPTREYRNLPPVVALHGRHADDWWHRRADLAGLKIHTHLSHPLDRRCRPPRQGQRRPESAPPPGPFRGHCGNRRSCRSRDEDGW